jgi:hypothetical protein
MTYFLFMGWRDGGKNIGYAIWVGDRINFLFVRWQGRYFLFEGKHMVANIFYYEV